MSEIVFMSYKCSLSKNIKERAVPSYSSKWVLIHSRFLPAVDNLINNWINSHMEDTLLSGIACVSPNNREP